MTAVIYLGSAAVSVQTRVARYLSGSFAHSLSRSREAHWPTSARALASIVADASADCCNRGQLLVVTDFTYDAWLDVLPVLLGTVSSTRQRSCCIECVFLCPAPSVEAVFRHLNASAASANNGVPIYLVVPPSGENASIADSGAALLATFALSDPSRMAPYAGLSVVRRKASGLILTVVRIVPASFCERPLTVVLDHMLFDEGTQRTPTALPPTVPLDDALDRLWTGSGLGVQEPDTPGTAAWQIRRSDYRDRLLDPLWRLLTMHVADNRDFLPLLSTLASSLRTRSAVLAGLIVDVVAAFVSLQTEWAHTSVSTSRSVTEHSLKWARRTVATFPTAPLALLPLDLQPAQVRTDRVQAVLTAARHGVATAHRQAVYATVDAARSAAATAVRALATSLAPVGWFYNSYLSVSPRLTLDWRDELWPRSDCAGVVAFAHRDDWSDDRGYIQ
jgi:hypothetical protein